MQSLLRVDATVSLLQSLFYLSYPSLMNYVYFGEWNDGHTAMSVFSSIVYLYVSMTLCGFTSRPTFANMLITAVLHLLQAVFFVPMSFIAQTRNSFAVSAYHLLIGMAYFVCACAQGTTQIVLPKFKYADLFLGTSFGLFASLGLSLLFIPNTILSILHLDSLGVDALESKMYLLLGITLLFCVTLEYLSSNEATHSYLVSNSVSHFGTAAVSLWLLTLSPTANTVLITLWVLSHVLIGTYLIVRAKNIETEDVKDFKFSQEEKIELGLAGEVQSCP